MKNADFTEQTIECGHCGTVTEDVNCRGFYYAVTCPDCEYLTAIDYLPPQISQLLKSAREVLQHFNRHPGNTSDANRSLASLEAAIYHAEPPHDETEPDAEKAMEPSKPPEFKTAISSLKYFEALAACYHSLRDWVDIAEPHDQRKADDEALALAKAILDTHSTIDPQPKTI